MSDPRPFIRRYDIAPEKLDGYLLDPSHPDGGSKAALFLQHNFTAEALRLTLLDHALAADWHSTRLRPSGFLFELRGGVLTPIGRGLVIRVVWAVDNLSSDTARLVTAYPL